MTLRFSIDILAQENLLQKYKERVERPSENLLQTVTKENGNCRADDGDTRRAKIEQGELLWQEEYLLQRYQERIEKVITTR